MSPAKTSSPLALICGDDEFAVKQRAKQLYQQWSGELGGMDHEIIEATVANSGEALAILGRLREALQTLPFFGSGKVVWLRDCNFLGDERAASAAAVTETLNELAGELKDFKWSGVRLLLSAGKVDKRKTFFKTLDKIGTVESFTGWSIDDRDWAERAEVAAQTAVRSRQKEISGEALGSWSPGWVPSHASLKTRLKNCACMSATARNDQMMWRPFARGTRRRGRLPSATRWGPRPAPPAPAAGRGIVGG